MARDERNTLHLSAGDLCYDPLNTPSYMIAFDAARSETDAWLREEALTNLFRHKQSWGYAKRARGLVAEKIVKQKNTLKDARVVSVYLSQDDVATLQSMNRGGNSGAVRYLIARYRSWVETRQG